MTRGVLAVLGALLAAAPAAAAPPVVATVGDDGFNPLHQEFRAKPGEPVVYPAGMPAPTFIDLPTAGTFDEQLAELRRGPLANLKPGVLYAIRGTRLLVISPGGADAYPDAIPLTSQTGSLGPRQHGTGVVASAIGSVTGTDPDALAVYVSAKPQSPEAWDWVAKQPWVDAATMSVYAVESVNSERRNTCTAAPEARRAVASGHMVFSSSGNTTDPQEQQIAPNGLPEVYQVGATDTSGKTFLPGSVVDPANPTYAYESPSRPYITGALGIFPAAAPDSFDGQQQFGGTSGASPRTAGYALRLIAAARALLGGGRNGANLATLAPGTVPPVRGPLADGNLTVAELSAVLRHTATPHEPASPGRYFVEGYGNVDDTSVATALKVLSGEIAEPARADEDTAHNAVTEARQRNFDTKCGG